MYERLSNKNETPTMEQFSTHIGSAKEGFELIENYLTGELKTAKNIYFDAHNKGWAIKYYIKKDYVCNITAEKDAFLLVTRLSEENVQKLCEIGTPHAKECIDSSPYRHRGWIEYRVLETKNVEEAKLLVQIRVSGKQTSIG